MSESRFSDIAELHKTILEPKTREHLRVFLWHNNLILRRGESAVHPLQFTKPPARVPPLLRVFEESGVCMKTRVSSKTRLSVTPGVFLSQYTKTRPKPKTAVGVTPGGLVLRTRINKNGPSPPATPVNIVSTMQQHRCKEMSCFYLETLT